MKVETPQKLKRTAQISVAVTPAMKRRIIEAAHGSERILARFMRDAAMAEVERVERAREKAARANK